MISVVIPVYNVEAFIAEALQSVLDQTYTNFEVLVIDDCSPDRSIEICESFDDSRIRIIRHTSNRGLAGARNTGIREARGKYIAFLDSDDVWHPQKLELHQIHLDKNPLIGISFSRSAFIDAESNRLNAYQMPALGHVSAGYYLCRNPIGNGSAPVVRQAVLDEIAFKEHRHGDEETAYFDEAFRQSEDIECWIRIRTTTQWRIEGLTEPLTLYRLNSGGLSADIPKQLASWEAVIEKTKSYAPDLIQTHGRAARAFQLRYLSRQAIRLKDGAMATRMVHQAIACHPAILVREPSRTLLTVAAAWSLRLVPRRLTDILEPMAVRSIGAVQSLRMSVTGNRPLESST